MFLGKVLLYIFAFWLNIVDFSYLFVHIYTLEVANFFMASHETKICHQEYNQPTCIFLGVQAGLSLFTSELTMVFAHFLGCPSYLLKSNL